MGNVTELGKWRGSGRVVRRIVCWLLAVSLLAGLAGCTRRFFRNRADEEVAEVLKEKDDPHWAIEQFHVYPDPRARFADPTNPDRPPMPPDDPGAWDLSPHPQLPGRSGGGLASGTGYLGVLAVGDAQNRPEKAARKEVTKQADDIVAQPHPKPETPTSPPQFPSVPPGETKADTQAEALGGPS